MELEVYRVMRVLPMVDEAARDRLSGMLSDSASAVPVKNEAMAPREYVSFIDLLFLI